MSNGTSRCRHCGEAIGIYEPMIVLHEGRPCRTSRAVEAASSGTAERHEDERYHDECYARTRGEDAVRVA